MTSRFEKLDGHRVAKIIYGTIIVLVVIVTLEDHPPSAMVTIGSVIGASIAVVLAEFYSELIGKRVHTRRVLTRTEYAEITTSVSAVLVPLPLLLLAWFQVISVETALLWDKFLLIGLLVFYGYAAAELSGTGRSWALAYALLAGTIGAVVVGLKAILSH